MQDRYVGDVGDFGKYGLLRHLMAVHQRLGVVWYLAPPESNGDGRHLSYLMKPREYRSCDPLLFDGMGSLVRMDRRSVNAVIDAGLLPPDSISYDRLVCPATNLSYGPSAGEARKRYRKDWMIGALSATKDCDLVFLDPDNGIGGLSFRPYGSKGHKHAAWDEIAQFASSANRTVVIYHHTGRSASAKEQARRLVECFRGAVPDAGAISVIGFRRGTHRMFLVAPPHERQGEVERQVNGYVQRWGGHCELLQQEKIPVVTAHRHPSPVIPANAGNPDDPSTGLPLRE